MGKVTIVELDINAEALIQKAADAKKALEDLQAQAALLKDEMANGQTQIQAYTQELANLQTQGEANNEQYTETLFKLDQLNQKYAALQSRLISITASINTETSAYKSAQQSLDVYNKTVTTETTQLNAAGQVIQKTSVAVNESTKSYNSLSAEKQKFSQTTNASTSAVSQEDAALSKEGKSLNEVKNKTEEAARSKQGFWAALKSGFDAGEGFNSLLESEIAMFPEIETGLKTFSKGMLDYSKSQWEAASSATGFSKALKIVKAGFASLGIGAIILVIGSLVSYLTSTTEGVNKLNQFLAPLQVMFSKVMGVVQDLGAKLVSAFSDPKQLMVDLYNFVKQNLINRFTAFGVILEGIMNLDFEQVANGAIQATTGVEGAINKMAEAGENLGNAWDEAKKKGAEIADLQAKIAEQEANYNLFQEDLTERLADQNKIINDQSKSTEDRVAAAEEALKIQKEMNQLEVDRAQNAFDLYNLQHQDNEMSIQQQKELSDLQAKLMQAKRKMSDDEEASRERINGLYDEEKKKIEEVTNKAKEELQKRQDAAIAASKTKLEIYKQENEDFSGTIEERLAIYKNILEQEKAILKQQLNAHKISYAEYTLALKKLDDQYTDRALADAKELADAKITLAKAELDAYLQDHQSLINSTTKLNDELVAQEKARLGEELTHRQAYAYEVYKQKQAEIDAENTSDEVKDAKRRALDLQYLTDKKALEEKFKSDAAAVDERYEEEQTAAAAAKHQEDYEKKLELADNEYEEKRIVENERYEQEDTLLKKRLADGEITQAEYDKIREKNEKEHNKILGDINEAQFNNKLNLAKDTLGNVGKLLGENTAAGKAAAIAQTTIDTYQAAVAAYKSLAGITIVGPALGAIAAAAAVASGLANVKKITSTKTPKAEKGAVFNIGGKRHSSGGTKFYGEDGTAFEAERGEKMFVLNRGASAAIAPLLSDINQKFGGVSLSRTSGYLAAGGQVVRSAGSVASASSTRIDYDALASRIGETVSAANSQLPAPVVAVEDINYGQSSYAQVVSGANI